MMEDTEREQSHVHYVIDVDWFAQRGFSFNDVLQARMCESCAGRLDEEVEERHTVLDKKTGRATFDIRRTKYGENALRVIHDCCSKKRNYITPDMPTLEAVFRVFLANGNTPMTVDVIREQLADWCPGGGCQWLLLPLEQLERLIRHDRFYGIHEAPQPAAA
ncbi:MAG: hypothetical protein IT305_07545 [Chloroflexi bacterium]|nr:hypothetical protein [Chloroflexota bacterium]